MPSKRMREWTPPPWRLVGCGIVRCDVCGTDDMVYRRRGWEIFRCWQHGPTPAERKRAD
jgi:hypothetical protein